MAAIIGISTRQLGDWRRGKSTIVEKQLLLLGEKFHVVIPKPDQARTESEMKSKAGTIGAKKRMELYGNPGTETGRKRGGRQSVANHKRNGVLYFTPKPVLLPKFSALLAEFIGIVLGDGGISKYQITITLHKHDDKDYAKYVKKTIETLFSVPAKTVNRTDENVVQLTISRIRVVNFLRSMEINIGSKVRQQTAVPGWITRNPSFARACVRGLFDTDGCFYVDRHLKNDALYLNGGLSFSNRSLPILRFFKESLEKLGFHPTDNGQYTIFLRRVNEIVRYFKEVGTRNVKYQHRFDEFMKSKYGRVPKRS